METPSHRETFPGPVPAGTVYTPVPEPAPAKPDTKKPAKPADEKEAE